MVIEFSMQKSHEINPITMATHWLQSGYTKANKIPETECYRDQLW